MIQLSVIGFLFLFQSFEFFASVPETLDRKCPMIGAFGAWWMVDPITEDKNIWLFFFFEFYIEFGQQTSMFYEPKLHWDFGVPNKQNRKLHD